MFHQAIRMMMEKMEVQSLESKQQAREIRAAMKEVQEELILKTLEAKVDYINAQGKKLEGKINKELREHRTEGATASDSSDSAAKDSSKVGDLASSSDKKGENVWNNDEKKLEKQEKEERAQRLQEVLKTEKKQTEELASDLEKVEADKRLSEMHKAKVKANRLD
eukprot:1106177-Heterocapsa_arctica.AAC.1